VSVAPASVRVAWWARPWVWAVVALAGPLALRAVAGDGARPVGAVVLWFGLVAAVAATIAKTHRWATRRTQVVAWLSGLGTLVGAV
jgi:uncharacterized RmlC-like cupin family protein